MPELWDDAPGDVSDWSIATPEAPEASDADNAPEAPERPRDEHGRFTKAEEPEAEPQPEVEPEPELILGKFRGVDDVVQAYTNLEQHAGSLRDELGQLRQVVEQRLVAPQVTQPPFDIDEAIERDPAHAAEMAWRSGNQQALEYTLDQWNEISPGARALWIDNKQLQVRLQQVSQETQPLREQSEERERLAVVAQAYSSLTAKYPDFDTMRPKMAEVAAELKDLSGQSVVDTLLNTGSPPAVARALEMLYKEARDRTTDNLSNVSQQLAQEHAQNSARARQEALVATVGSTGEDTTPLSTADRIAESWAKADAPYKSGEDGWNI